MLAEGRYRLGDTGQSGYLPAAPTALIGREALLADVRNRVLGQGARQVTLTGPGGAGKTRLALAAATMLQDAFADGAWFVDLAPVRDPGLVLGAIARSLGIRETGRLSLEAAVHGFLRTRQVLLLLDNFEQVLPAADGIGAMLEECSGVTALVTSRAPLRLRWEQVVPVPPLSAPDLTRLPPLPALAHVPAVALFIRRAQALRPSFQLEPSNAPAVAELCVRLDGLPLAIELAAARTGVLTPGAMVARLEQRLDLLARGARDLPARQQTLREAIGWSYGLLDGEAQALFRRLAVFAGSCSLEAVSQLQDHGERPGANLLDLLGSLVENQLLLRQDGPNGVEPRFSMLETIRAYAQERLEAAGEAEEAGRRHAELFLALALRAERALRGHGQVAWLDRIERDHHNERAALRWALERDEPQLALRLAGAMWPFWWMRGYLSEGRQWLETALARSDAGTTTDRAKALVGLGWLLRALGASAGARPFLEEALASFRAAGDRPGIALALHSLGAVSHDAGDLESASALYRESLELRRLDEDTWGIAYMLNSLGVIARDRGDAGTATALCSESLALRRGMGDTWGMTHSLQILGEVARDQGDYGRAAALHEESIALARQLGDKRLLAHGLKDLGAVARDQGQVARATDLAREALVLFRDLADRWGLEFALLDTAHLCVARRDPVTALRLFGAAAALREATGISLPSLERGRYERGLAAARAAVGQQVAGTEGARGAAWPLERAVEEAIRTLTPAAEPEDVRLAELTAREREVALLLGRGSTNRQIAETLVVSERTAEAHVANVLAKLGMSRRAQVAALLGGEQPRAPPDA